MRTSLRPRALVAAALAFTCAAVLAPPQTLNAEPLPETAIQAFDIISDAEGVLTHGLHPHAAPWAYRPRVHGRRARYRRGVYIYFYDGWWYSRPWWRTPPRRVARCEYWSNQCIGNWGFDNPDYYGCLRYYGCY